MVRHCYSRISTWTYLVECSTLGDLLDTLDKRAQVGGRNSRVTDKLDQVVNDNNGSALDLHRTVVQGTDHERDEDGESRCSDLRNERGVRKRLDTCRHGVGVGHALDKHRDVGAEIGVRERGAERGRAFHGSGGDLHWCQYPEK